VLYPISAVHHQPDKTRRPSAQRPAELKCGRKQTGHNKPGRNILGIPKEPRKPRSDAQPGRGFAGVFSFAGFRNFAERVQPMPLVWDNTIWQFPVGLPTAAALHNPQAE